MPIALVTGAGRGLGLSFTRQLLARGDRVLATVRSLRRARELEALQRAHPTQLHILQLDQAEAASIHALRDGVLAISPSLDLLILNAGINSRGVKKGQANARLGDLEPEGISTMVRVNAIGPLLVAQALLEPLSAGERPRVVALSSWLGSIEGKTRGGNYGYCASKTTLNMLMRTLALDLLPKGIVCAVINPGWVSTDMGGPRADLSPETSVGGMLSVIDAMGPEQAGRFLQWDGAEVSW